MNKDSDNDFLSGLADLAGIMASAEDDQRKQSFIEFGKFLLMQNEAFLATGMPQDKAWELVKIYYSTFIAKIINK